MGDHNVGHNVVHNVGHNVGHNVDHNVSGKTAEQKYQELLDAETDHLATFICISILSLTFCVICVKVIQEIRRRQPETHEFIMPDTKAYDNIRQVLEIKEDDINIAELMCNFHEDGVAKFDEKGREYKTVNRYREAVRYENKIMYEPHPT